MNLLAIDPGTTESAWYILSNGCPNVGGKELNSDLLSMLHSWRSEVDRPELVIEMVASYGMPVGAEVFETVYWIGRFAEAYRGNAERIFRRDVKLHLCKSPKANDATIRQALIDRFGPGKEKAIGSKKAPGPLYGVKADVWAALALAVTYYDKKTGSI